MEMTNNDWSLQHKAVDNAEKKLHNNYQKNIYLESKRINSLQPETGLSLLHNNLSDGTQTKKGTCKQFTSLKIMFIAFIVIICVCLSLVIYWFLLRTTVQPSQLCDTYSSKTIGYSQGSRSKNLSVSTYCEYKSFFQNCSNLVNDLTIWLNPNVRWPTTVDVVCPETLQALSLRGFSNYTLLQSILNHFQFVDVINIELDEFSNTMSLNGESRETISLNCRNLSISCKSCTNILSFMSTQFEFPNLSKLYVNGNIFDEGGASDLNDLLAQPELLKIVTLYLNISSYSLLSTFEPLESVEDLEIVLNVVETVNGSKQADDDSSFQTCSIFPNLRHIQSSKWALPFSSLSNCLYLSVVNIEVAYTSSPRIYDVRILVNQLPSLEELHLKRNFSGSLCPTDGWLGVDEAMCKQQPNILDLQSVGCPIKYKNGISYRLMRTGGLKGCAKRNDRQAPKARKSLK